MKCVVTAKPGTDRAVKGGGGGGGQEDRRRMNKGLLWHCDLVQVADYPVALHAQLLDLLHTFEVAFPLRNTQGQPLGASVIIARPGSMGDALPERDPGKERKAAVRAKGGGGVAAVRAVRRARRRGGGGGGREGGRGR